MKFSFAATSALVALAAASPLGAAPSPTGSVTNQPLPADSSVGSLIGSFLSLIKGWAGAAGSAHGQGHGYGRIALPTFLDAPAISGLEEIEDYLKFAVKNHGGQGVHGSHSSHKEQESESEQESENEHDDDNDNDNDRRSRSH
ncbi:hypothetical protein IWQ57_005494 [Coemansia nantahalensis]|uniref:Uncharacterized protein n=1 Tax=Coemansia nantahalensis TaxID=2789366 RepID=A0ACC1JMS6_9FUNG|nr:hypothetical protein IWQ57_005494 [Coemansia nantahalensis]